MSEQTFVTVKEAAQRLSVNEKTVRRWIRSGKLAATLTDGAYGQQYRVPVQALETAQTALTVVEVERPASPQTLALAVAQAVEQAISASERRLTAELSQLHDEVAALTTEVRALKPVDTPPPDSPEVPEAAPDAQRPKPSGHSWWRFWARSQAHSATS